jgi:hypothetical protein
MLMFSLVPVAEYENDDSTRRFSSTSATGIRDQRGARARPPTILPRRPKILPSVRNMDGNSLSDDDLE